VELILAKRIVDGSVASASSAQKDYRMRPAVHGVAQLDGLRFTAALLCDSSQRFDWGIFCSGKCRRNAQAKIAQIESARV